MKSVAAQSPSESPTPAGVRILRVGDDQAEPMAGGIADGIIEYGDPAVELGGRPRPSGQVAELRADDRGSEHQGTHGRTGPSKNLAHRDLPRLPPIIPARNSHRPPPDTRRSRSSMHRKPGIPAGPAISSGTPQRFAGVRF